MNAGPIEKSRAEVAVRQAGAPAYVPPTITTYTSEQILEKIGPAQACSANPCGIP